jgi:hypothetical protein
MIEVATKFSRQNLPPIYRDRLFIAPIALSYDRAGLFHGKSFSATIGARALFIGAGVGLGPCSGDGSEVRWSLSGSLARAGPIKMILVLRQ